MIHDNFIDIHSHIIPGVDDGAKTLTESMALLDKAYEEGIRTIIATPHFGIENGYAPSSEIVRKGFSELCDKAAQAHPDVRLFCGCELYFAPERLRARAIGRTMAASDYLLVEFLEYGDKHESAAHICNCLIALAVQGKYRPILAHAERYRDFDGKLAEFRHLVQCGVYLQINAYDLFENSNEKTRETTQWLVKNRLAHFIGTDTHWHRPPVMRSGVEYLYANCSEEYVDALVFGNATKLLNNDLVDLIWTEAL